MLKKLKVRIEDHRPEFMDEGVAEHHQTMPRDRAFWVFFSGNMAVATWLLGVWIGGMGMSVRWSVLALALGTFLGSLLVGLLATMGPKTRLSQMEATRLAFGKKGMRIPALLNWVSCVGWDAINNVPSAVALVAFIALFGVHAPFWIALAILAGAQMVIAIYGHDLVQAIQRTLGWLLFVAFVGIGCMAISNHAAPLPTVHPATIKSFILAVSLAASFNMGWAPFASDYTRYLPKKTPSRQTFWLVFTGSSLSILVLGFFGIMTAGAIPNATPEGAIDALQKFGGSWGPIILGLLIFSCIPPNVINDNTAAYNLISAGLRLPRHLAAVIGGLTGFVIALLGVGHFMEFFENMLLLFLHWIAPWAAMLLIHWAAVGKRDLTHRHGWTQAATIWLATTVFTFVFFSASPFYTSPIAKALGGVDIGYYVGFVVAAVWYGMTLRKLKRG